MFVSVVFHPRVVPARYNQRKYVWKLVYIHMLGYEVDFGAMEIINLITSTKFVEKSTGYLATSIILNQASESMELIVNALRNDLVSGSQEAKSLALQCVSNMGDVQLADSVTEFVYNLLVGQQESANVRKKAALCLLRVLRATEKPCPAAWHAEIFRTFDCDHFGLITASSALVLSMVSKNAKACFAIVPRCILILEKLVVLKSATYECVGVAPWRKLRRGVGLKTCAVLRLEQFSLFLLGDQRHCSRYNAVPRLAAGAAAAMEIAVCARECAINRPAHAPCHPTQLDRALLLLRCAVST